MFDNLTLSWSPDLFQPIVHFDMKPGELAKIEERFATCKLDRPIMEDGETSIWFNGEFWLQGELCYLGAFNGDRWYFTIPHTYTEDERVDGSIPYDTAPDVSADWISAVPVLKALKEILQ